MRSQSRESDLGTAKRRVSRYSEGGTKSDFLRIGARERVERLPLGRLVGGLWKGGRDGLLFSLHRDEGSFDLLVGGVFGFDVVVERDYFLGYG